MTMPSRRAGGSAPRPPRLAASERRERFAQRSSCLERVFSRSALLPPAARRGGLGAEAALRAAAECVIYSCVPIIRK
jgi:hypothetical protein